MVPQLRLRSIRATPVAVPMNRVLGTSQASITVAPLLLIDVETEEGVTGHSYLFCYVQAASVGILSILNEVERVTAGFPIAPLDLWLKLSRHFGLIGVQGIVRMAMSGFDVACWDALAIAANQPLASLLGGGPRPIPAYNSNGLGLMPTEALADEAEELLEGGFQAIKLRLGYTSLEQDLAAVCAVRKRIDRRAKIMVDYNQALSVAEALKRGRALDNEDIYWIEEPVRHDDYRGCASISCQVRTPLQIGENFSQPQSMAEAISARASAYVMPDLERIGGVTGWQRAAALAAANNIEMSSHLFPEVSAHLLAVTPTCHWLEYVDWAAPLLQEPLKIVNGNAIVPACAGNGLSWDQKAVAHYKIH